MTATADNHRVELKNVYRFGAFALAVAIGVTTLTSRMFYLQVIQGQGTDQGSTTTQATAKESIPSTRGLIFDAAGAPLVKNVVDYSVTVTPSDLPLDQELTVATRLGSVLNMDPIYIETQIDSTTGSLYEPITIADGVSDQVARFLQENADLLPGVKVVVTSKRQYLTKDLFAELIGYEGQITAAQYAQLKADGYSAQDVVGQAGLENYYEPALRGTYGSETVALDDAGKPIPGLVTTGQEAIPGDSLTLNIDTKEQTYAYTALATGLANAKVTKGVIIVENPQNGKILAMVSLPGYDNNMFAEGISQAQYEAMLQDPAGPLINKAISEQYPPGSTYKLVTGTAGLAGDPETGQKPSITATSTIPSLPYIQIGDQRFGEWNGTGWGPLTIIMGLAHSSDTFFYQLALKVGLTSLTDWAKLYGFGKPTGIDLPGEVGGIVPDDQWKQAAYGIGDTMFPGEIAQAGIGQGFDAVTPMQLLNAYCALANGGNLWQPTVVKSTTDPDGTVHDVTPTLIRKLPVSSADLETLRQGTRAVVTSQHTYNLVDLPVMVAGKTGTAEFGTRNAKGQLPYHEWFVGYTPGDAIHGNFNSADSQVAVVAFLYGADSWGDMSTEIVKYFLWEYYGIKGSPLAQSLPGHVQLWASKITNNYYGSASNH